MVVRCLPLSLLLLVGLPAFALTKPIPAATEEQIAREWIGVFAGGLWHITFKRDGTGTCHVRYPDESAYHRLIDQYRIYSWSAKDRKVRFACRGVEGTAGRWLFEADFIPGRGTVTDTESEKAFEVVPVEVLKNAP